MTLPELINQWIMGEFSMDGLRRPHWKAGEYIKIECGRFIHSDHTKNDENGFYKIKVIEIASNDWEVFNVNFPLSCEGTEHV